MATSVGFLLPPWYDVLPRFQSIPRNLFETLPASHNSATETPVAPPCLQLQRILLRRVPDLDAPPSVIIRVQFREKVVVSSLPRTSSIIQEQEDWRMFSKLI